MTWIGQPATGAFEMLSVIRPLIDDVPEAIGRMTGRCCAATRGAANSSDITAARLAEPMRPRFMRMGRDSSRRDAMRLGLAGFVVMIASMPASAQTQAP